MRDRDQPASQEPKAAVACSGWPFDAVEARRRQSAAGPTARRSVDLGGGVRLDLVIVPRGEFPLGDSDGEADERPAARVRIERPFWIGVCEVSNEQFARFDPTHDSRVESKNGYQFGVHGFPVNGPRQPVVRVSWHAAMAFCRWLAARTGEPFTLPTEAQWEYACRAGTQTAAFWGGAQSDFSRSANLADAKLSEFATDPDFLYKLPPKPSKYDDWLPKASRFCDGAMVTADVGTREPNAWGLCDMLGNAAEWTRSAYRSYPYDPSDGREEASAEGRKTVRGGSWRDLPRDARSAARWAYQPWQGVYNVGFRVVCPAL